MYFAFRSKCLSDIFNVIMCTCAETAGAECKSVSLGWIKIKIFLDRFLAVNDLRKIEERERRIIRMNREIDVALFCNRNNSIKEILDVPEVIFRRNILIELDVFSHLAESLRLPARETEVVSSVDHGRSDGLESKL